LGLRAQGLGLIVHGAEYRGKGLRLEGHDSGVRVYDLERRV